MSLEAVFPLLANVGFRKRAGYVFTLDLAPGVLGWLGLNRAKRHRAPGEVMVYPVVGVRFQDVERVVAECRGEKFHPYLPPTISSPLGYVMPEKKLKGWVLGPDSPECETADMTSAIAVHGVEFMRSVVELPVLRQRLDEGLGFDHQLVYRRPVAALIAGDLRKARAFVDEELETIGARTDLAAEDFKRFADAFRGRLKSA